MPNASSPRVLSRINSFLNTMFYDSMCLKDPHGQLLHVLVSKCDDFEDCDVTIMTSQLHDVINDITNRRAIGNFLQVPIGHEPLNRLDSEIFSIKVANRQTQRHTHTHHIDTSTDNNGHLNLAAREPITKYDTVYVNNTSQLV